MSDLKDGSYRLDRKSCGGATRRKASAHVHACRSSGGFEVKIHDDRSAD